jgi:hypothetical protein
MFGRMSCHLDGPSEGRPGKATGLSAQIVQGPSGCDVRSRSVRAADRCRDHDTEQAFRPRGPHLVVSAWNDAVNKGSHVARDPIRDAGPTFLTSRDPVWSRPNVWPRRPADRTHMSFR